MGFSVCRAGDRLRDPGRAGAGAPAAKAQTTAPAPTPKPVSALAPALSAEDAELVALQAEIKKSFRESVTPFVKNYCQQCHGNRRSKGGINLEVALRNPGGVAFSKHWKAAIATVNSKDMPPDDEDALPSDAERQAFVDWIAKLKFLSPKDPGLCDPPPHEGGVRQHAAGSLWRGSGHRPCAAG
ncbi:c-type cytochrome domain-containing protein [Verrucomicrobium spinosum]|uniref:c-type cytochrome domain-containing protein n=1 Tax=Verrucomicrobium spinosum TaxID=2736 RepID=UPI0012E1DB74|nr:c-type cytochrome domain-containing protein [Verrucomicrobium spinosum]